MFRTYVHVTMNILIRFKCLHIKSHRIWVFTAKLCIWFSFVHMMCLICTVIIFNKFSFTIMKCNIIQKNGCDKSLQSCRFLATIGNTWTIGKFMSWIIIAVMDIFRVLMTERSHNIHNLWIVILIRNHESYVKNVFDFARAYIYMTWTFQ